MIILCAANLREVRHAVTEYTGSPVYRQVTAAGSAKIGHDRIVEETTDTPLAVEVLDGEGWDSARSYYLVSIPFLAACA